MMECERCKCWVHARCEGLSSEKYDILSLLPDSVEFICRRCSSDQPAPWWLAVDAEMKAGLLAVLKSLSKNRKACDLLKCRANICGCGEGVRPRVLRCMDLFEPSYAESLKLTEMTIKVEPSNAGEECLNNGSSCLTDNIPKSDKCVNKCVQRTKLITSDCSLDVQNQELQLKVESDMSYQDKAAQLSPHATSQSDSGIGSTDDELKPPNDKCYCVRSELWTKTHPTLLTIKKKVNSNGYKSLGQFNKEMEGIIGTVQNMELLKLYSQSLEDVFPWFDPKCPEYIDEAAVDNPIMSTKEESVALITKAGSDGIEKRSELEGKLNQNCDYYYNMKVVEDDRICVLCKMVGEGHTTEEGRLLYCGHNDWIHTNCALWSNEVFEEIDGSLQNVQSAISRSRHIRCSRCSKKGASIGCCNRSCPEAYHISCAKISNCIFFEDKSLYCANHRNDTKASRQLSLGSDFVVSRPVYVEIEQKKKKCVAKQDVRVMIGSLTINNLGDFVPELSDEKCSIIPVDFQCSRLYWSSVEPWRLVHYKIVTKIVYSVVSDTLADNDKNHTIEHPVITTTDTCALTDEHEVRQVINHILESVCTKQVNDTKTCIENTELITRSNDEEVNTFPTVVTNSKLDSKYEGDQTEHCKSDVFELKETQPKTDMQIEAKPIDYREKNETIVDFKDENDQAFASKNQEGKICSKYEEETQTGNILPPELEQEIFEDLPHDILDGISMQDIFPKLDFPPVESKPCKEDQNKSKLKKLKLEIKKLDTEKLFPSKSNTIRYDRRLQTTSQCSVVLKRVSTVPREDLKRAYAGNKSKDQWRLPKIIQIDGAGDLSEGSDSGSPVKEIPFNTMFPNSFQCTVTKKMFQTQTSRKPRILQVDGVDDSVLSSSSSECGSPMRDDEANWKLGQVDGTTDLCNLNKQLEENPVRCTRCRRTYRTAQSFERHLQSCSTDYTLSFSESESSEEEKVSSPEVVDLALTDNEQSHYDFKQSNPGSNEKRNQEQNNELRSNTSTGGTKFNVENSLQGSSIDFVTENPKPYSVANGEIVTISNQMLDYQVIPSLQQTTFNCGHTKDISNEGNPSLRSEECEEILPMTIPLKTYSRKPKVDTYTSICESGEQSKICEYNTSVMGQPMAVSPTMILQQVPMHTTVSPYIDNLSQTATSGNIQYQYVTTKPQVPLTIQLQPQINIQPVIPTVFGALIQPNVVDHMVVNGPAPTVDVFNQQPLFITNVNQPVFMGMETLINSSTSQFMSSNFPTTTSQGFSTTKPMVSLPQGFIVVNSQSNHNAYQPQPWTYNYQETYKVKEKTTYQEVSRQMVQDVRNTNCGKMADANQDIVLIDNPIVKEVTVEKTRSIQKTASINPLLVVNNMPTENQCLFNNSVAVKDLSPPLTSQTPAQCQENLPNKIETYRQEVRNMLNYSQSNKTLPKKFDLFREQSSQELMLTNSNLIHPKNIVACQGESQKMLSFINSNHIPLQEGNVGHNDLEKRKPFSQENIFNFKLNNTLQNIVENNPKIYSPQESNKQILVKDAIKTIKPVITKVKPDLTKKTCNIRINITDSRNIKLNGITNGCSNTIKPVVSLLLQEKLNSDKLPLDRINTHVSSPLKKQELVKLSPDKKKPIAYLPSPVKPIKVKQPLNSINSVSSLLHIRENQESIEQSSEKVKTDLVKLCEKKNSESVGLTFEKVKTNSVFSKLCEKKRNESTQPKRIPLKENKSVANKTKVSNNPKMKFSPNNMCKPKLVYEITSPDGMSVCSQNLSEAWRTIYEAVQSARAAKSLPPLPQNPYLSDLRILGLDNHSVKYLVEQVADDGSCTKYQPVYHKSKLMNASNQLSENPTGCARTEPRSNNRRKYDMFSWLASRHRQPPKLIINTDTEIINGVSRRATSLNLPMAMRFRHLKETSKESVGVFRSDIHGRGLFCLRDIDSGEMVIEYAGEVIRSGLTDQRENYYTAKGIGCYMFRIDDHFVVDATMHGNAARFINHSCEPNCYSRVVDILGKKHILIFALRKIPQGEELTYDYKFPLEDDKITCHCLSRKCRKYLN